MTHPTPTGYRPDIDGLRAVAVLSVVLFHAGFGALSGGFVGVDVFFVISGYLITRLLMQEIQATGRVDFGEFYLRRVRRLLPALYAVLAVTTCVAAALLTPYQLRSFGGSLLHATLSASNLFFFAESGYFDAGSVFKPLLHTWSLGVEEQFYLVWPLLLWLIVSKARSAAAAIVLLLGALSFGAALYWIDSAPTAVFFWMPFRIAEFSIGAALVFLPARPTLPRGVADALTATGLALIAWAVFTYTKTTRFPGAAALVPSLGAALCIAFAPHARVGALLRTRVMVGIGLVSYSLYLVHWPLIVLYKMARHRDLLRMHESIAAVALSALLAWALHRWVEDPARSPTARRGRLLAAIVLSTLALAYCGASMWATNGWQWRPWMQQEVSLHTIDMERNRRFSVRQRLCAESGWARCDAPQPGQVNVLIVGDSHAIDALNALYAVQPSVHYAMSELGGCPPYRDIEAITLPIHPDRERCVSLNQQRYDAQWVRQYDLVVINVLFGWYTPAHLDDYLSFLQQAGVRRVVVWGGYYEAKEDFPELVNRLGQNTSALLPALKLTADDATVRAVAERHGAWFISKQEALGVGPQAQLFGNAGALFSYDQHHLSYDAAVRMATKERERLSDVLAHPSHFPVTTATHSALVLDWGPREAMAGSSPNRQPDGRVGIWIKMPPSDATDAETLYVNGRQASVLARHQGLLAATLDPTLLKTPGTLTLDLCDQTGRIVAPLGTMTITAASTKAD